MNLRYLVNKCIPKFQRSILPPSSGKANVYPKCEGSLLIKHVGSGVPRGVQNPLEIPKVLQNCAKLNQIVKTVKN